MINGKTVIIRRRDFTVLNRVGFINFPGIIYILSTQVSETLEVI